MIREDHLLRPAKLTHHYCPHKITSLRIHLLCTT